MKPLVVLLFSVALCSSCQKYRLHHFGCKDGLGAPGGFLPNIFTPNGDGNNDYYQLFHDTFSSYSNFSIEIKSKLGKKVFESNDPNFKWDGTNNGKQVKEDVYNVCIEGHQTEVLVFDSSGVPITQIHSRNFHSDGPVTLHRMAAGKYDGDCVVDFSHCQFGSQWDGSAFTSLLPTNEFCD